MPFATITPTRGDRPELLEFCKHQLSRMTVKPDKSYFIDESYLKPIPGRVDLVSRVFMGFREAIKDGFDEVFIIEDDDYYRPDYFEYMAMGKGVDLIGVDSTVYYHLGQKGYKVIDHPKRASLFQTGFRISSLRRIGYTWPQMNDPFLDLHIWDKRNHKGQRLTKEFVRATDTKNYREMNIAIGMKHGIGLCGGSGHRMQYDQGDAHLAFLRDQVDPEAYIFYSTIISKLKN